MEMHVSDHRYGENYKKIILITIKNLRLIEQSLKNGKKSTGKMSGMKEGGIR